MTEEVHDFCQEGRIEALTPECWPKLLARDDR